MQVCIGGFHVSGCLAMLPERPDSLNEALDLGISLFAGEAEGRFAEVLRDAAAGNAEADLQLPQRPAGPRGRHQSRSCRASGSGRTIGMISSFDAGRGCPFLCSFCTIINVQGRKSRYRSADDIERLVRSNHANGIRYFLITDDNLARNRNWESIFDRLIALRQEGLHSRFVIQVDTMCHKIPRFIEKAAAAGVKRVFIGLENINPDNLSGAKKKQNHIADYREMLLAWRKVRVHHLLRLYPGLPERHARIDRPRHRDHQARAAARHSRILRSDPAARQRGPRQGGGRRASPIDPDLNKFDLEHVVCDHPRMTREAMAGGLSAGVEDLLHRGPHQDGDPPRGGGRPPRRHGRLSPDRGSGRAGASTTSIRSRPASSAARSGATAGRACRSRTR